MATATDYEFIDESRFSSDRDKFISLLRENDIDMEEVYQMEYNISNIYIGCYRQHFFLQIKDGKFRELFSYEWEMGRDDYGYTTDNDGKFSEWYDLDHIKYRKIERPYKYKNYKPDENLEYLFGMVSIGHAEPENLSDVTPVFNMKSIAA